MVILFNSSKDISFLTNLPTRYDLLIVNVTPTLKPKTVIRVLKDFFKKYPNGRVIILSRISYLKSKDVLYENKNIKTIERLAYIFSKKYHINCIRIGNIIENKKNLIHKKIKEALLHGRVTYSINESFYYFISKHDVITAIKKILRANNISGKIFNITLSKVTEEEVVYKIKEKIFFIPEPLYTEVESTNDKIINFSNNDLISFYPKITLKKYISQIIKDSKSISSLKQKPLRKQKRRSFNIKTFARNLKNLNKVYLLKIFGSVIALFFLILFLLSLDFLGNNYLFYKYYKKGDYAKSLVYINRLRNTYLPTKYGNNYRNVYDSIYYGLQAYSLFKNNYFMVNSPNKDVLNNIKELVSLSLNFGSKVNSKYFLFSRESVFFDKYSFLFSEKLPKYIDLLDLLPLFKKESNFVVLIQNSNEIRPTGGFIGSYALVKVRDFKIIDYKFDDIYNIDGFLNENYPEILMKTPPNLVEHIDSPYIFSRDLGLILDPDLRNKYAFYYFEKALNTDIDGIVYLNSNIIKELLTTSGPIYLGTYKTEINKENFDVLAQEFAEKNYYSGSSQKSNFLNVLGSRYLEYLKNNPDNYLKLINVFLDLLYKKELLLYLKEPAYQKVLNIFDLDNLSSRNLSKDYDYLYILESSLSENKVNKLTKKKVSLNVKYDLRRNLKINDLVITLENPSKDTVWPYGIYKGLLNILIPSNATVVKALLTQPNAKDLNILRRLTTLPLKNDFLHLQIPFAVPLNSKVIVTVSYEQDTPPPQKYYSIFVPKQPGTKAFDFTLNLYLPNKIDFSKNYLIENPIHINVPIK